MESVVQDNLFAEERPTRWARFTAAPVILQAYVVFAIGATVLGMNAFIPSLSRVIVPFTGSISLILYANTLIFATFTILVPQRKMVFGIVMFLALFVVFGVFDLIRHLNESDDDVLRRLTNPYLTYHVYQPVFTISMPSAWILLLLSPAMRRWIKSSSVGGTEPRRHQLSLTDLLYFMLVVSVSLAMSLALVGIVKRRDPRPAAPGLPTPTLSTTPGQVALTK